MILFALIFLLTGAFASGEDMPDWFSPLMDAIYEQKLTADEIVPIYNEVSSKARNSLSGAHQYIVLSRCEHFMGRAYFFEERKNEARARYDDGIIYAQRALELQESADGWVMLAENISQSCAVRPASYALANGLKVEKYAKNALNINSRNAAAYFLIAARWIYAPTPLHNYNKGIQLLSEIPVNSDMKKDDTFNVYISTGYGYMQLKNNTQARLWFSKAAEIYPTNKFLKSLIDKL
jgi:tetratricopeptide (TPR) repeat protein